MTNTERFLVINVSRIGDTLLATPAIRAIANARPNAAIDCLGHPKRMEILRHLPFIRRVGSITKKRAPFLGWLGGERYDTALVFGFDAELVTYALRVARRVVAFRQTDSRLNARLFRAVDVPVFQQEHSVLQLLRLPAALDIPPAGLRLAYTTAPGEDLWAKQTLSRELSAKATPIVGLQIASFPTKGYRDWPLGHFIVLCERIRRQWPGAHFLIFGGREEHERTCALKEHLDTAATLFAGRITLRQTVALMKCTDLYIGVDTGPTHLMSTLDIPMISLYHGFSPSRLIGPLETTYAYPIDHPLASAGCSTDAPMSDIGVDEVWQTICRALADNPPRLR